MQGNFTEVSRDSLPPICQLTIITVCWNALADLKPTVESVQRQKAKGSISIEHVVVDGASTDGTPEWLAEQLAAGNIEQYVSEPDRGIYDAMNKGINMARGRVLLFLNADDELTDADLRPCVEPIVQGRTTAVAAVAEVYEADGRLAGMWKPNPDQMYLGIMCCHQAYFASAEACRRLGGYDAASYKTAADSDLIDRLGAEQPPLVVETVSSKFMLGGFSTDCDDKYRDEFIEFFSRGWPHVRQRCESDEAYRGLVAAYVYWQCRELHDWQQRWGRGIGRQLEALQGICHELAALHRNPVHRACLRWVAAAYLPVLMADKPAAGWRRLLMEAVYRLGRIPSTNPYAGVSRSAVRPPYLRWFLGKLFLRRRKKSAGMPVA